MTSQTAAVGTAPTKFGAEPLALTWKQQTGLIAVSIINFLLTVLTLGIYQFWGKTEVRRRIWSAVRLNGEPLEYTGTGWELFIGFLMVFFAIFLPVTLGYAALIFLFGLESPVVLAAQILLYVGFFFLLGIGVHRALRYRLARTRWRGIRGGLEGSSLGYAWTHFWTALLIPLTLGWIMPWRTVRLQSRLANGMRFGDRPFKFAARSGPLYGRFAIAWFGTILSLVLVGIGAGAAMYFSGAAAELAATPPGQPASPPPAFVITTIAAVVAFYILLGLLFAWYQAAKMNHFAAHTHYEGATFKGTATAWSLIWLIISNMLIVTLTLGLLAPVAQARGARYMVDRMSIDGAVPLADILQRSEDPTRGEGLAQVFDVDAF